ncbi:uncharacterized protein [Triticum aestivum]|uniref:uncharacterized protein n=1 Tax=Triticum aestivum TaxID=4565 RepID=UPI001D027F80|nr:uncharacterized protein LOC123120176 [Triticum aestivum]
MPTTISSSCASGSAASATRAATSSARSEVPLPSLPDSIQSRALGLQLVADFWFWGRCADVQKEEKKVEKAIRAAAKALAKELVQSRKAVNHLYENKAQLNSISMHLGKIDAAINSLNNKTHMKILLKWMWGRRIFKLLCT